MKLTGHQIQQIRDALLDAYPSRNLLRMMVRIELEEDLEAIADGENQRVMIFNLVSWAERNGRVDDLITGAYEQNQGNPALQQLVNEWRAPKPSGVEPVLTSPLVGVSRGSGPASIDLFLSYSRRDGDAMHKVLDDLREAGLSVWTDEGEGLEPGTPDWKDAIEDAIGQAQAMVVLLSPDAKASAWVGNEVTYAQLMGKRVFTVLVAGDPPLMAVPIELIKVQWVDGRQDLRRAIAQELRPAIMRYLHRPITLPIEFDWVIIPASEFLMGSDKSKDKQAYDDEMQQHKVYLPEFQIAKYPITNHQYAIFVKATGHDPPQHWKEGLIPQSKSIHPVVNVSWNDANKFCEWASKATDRNICLPSEAEWEKAARGEDGRIWPWGNQAPPDQRCNCDVNLTGTTPINKYPEGASVYGVMDMAGNVWEWTTTIWGQHIKDPDYKYPYDACDGREIADAPSSTWRVLRSGAYVKWANREFHARCAARGRFLQNRAFRNIGFRVVTP